MLYFADCYNYGPAYAVRAAKAAIEAAGGIATNVTLDIFDAAVRADKSIGDNITWTTPANMYVSRHNRVYAQIKTWYPNPDQQILVTSISLSASKISLGVGVTSATYGNTVTATVKPSDATNKKLNWTSENAAIATVNSTGVVTGKSAGSATITATATDGSGIKASYTVYVIAVPTMKVGGTSVSTKSNTNWNTKNSLTLNWSASGATGYQYKIITLNEVPSDDEDQGGRAVSTVVNKTTTSTTTSYTISAANLATYAKTATHLKIWVKALNSNGDAVGPATWIGVKLVSPVHTPDPEFLTPISVSEGTYAGDTYMMTFDTSTSVSYIVVCYESGSSLKEKADKFYASTYGNATSSKISWSIPYQFEHTGNSDTRTVILRCYNSDGDYETKTSKSFICKTNEAAPTISLSVSPATIDNSGNNYFTLSIKHTNTSNFTVSFSGFKCVEEYRKNVKGESPSSSWNGDLGDAGQSYSSSQQTYNLKFYPAAGTAANSYTITVTVSGNGGTQRATITINVVTNSDPYPNTWVNTGKQIIDLVGVAETQKGYTGSNTSSNLTGKLKSGQSHGDWTK